MGKTFTRRREHGSSDRWIRQAEQEFYAHEEGDQYERDARQSNKKLTSRRKDTPRESRRSHD